MGITGSSLFPVFSQEILDEVLDHLDPECDYQLETLRVCAITCPQLRVASQKRLFHTIRLPLSSAVLGGSVRRLREVLNSNPRLGTYVKILSVIDSVDPSPFSVWVLDDENLASVVARFTRLRGLSWIAGQGTDWTKIPDKLQRALISAFALPSLLELRLAGFIHFPLSIFKCCRHLKLLKVQAFMNIVTDLELPLDIGQLEAPEINLDALSLVVTRQDTSHRALHYLAAHNPPFKLDSLKRLSINVVNDLGHTALVQKLINANTQTLDSLILHPLFTEDDDEDDLADINLSSLTSLKRITVHFPLAPFDMPMISFQWLTSLFDNAPEKTVKHVLISVYTTEDDTPTALTVGDWAGIAECLCDEAFDSLESVMVSIYAAQERWEEMATYARALMYHLRTLEDRELLWVTLNDDARGTNMVIEL
ncbi:hypothetical protein BDN72DRAFT_958647 [Pluteus cervinus]|uniref:Uncharacterized protein n=1 Tax=Pluteus cervinus TaxID=181527 RepID=A0ACD3B0C5_9AGAR|nr:hypothetical protein BDN72DRAFT_958647 [Pluteus cervinus]